MTPIWCSKSSNETLLLLLIHPNPFTSLFELSECYKVNVPYVLLFWKCPPHFVFLTEPGSSQGHVFLLKGWLYYYFCLLWIDSEYGGEWDILNYLLLISSSNTFLPLPFSKKHLLERIHQNIPLLTFPVFISQTLGHPLFIEDVALFSSSPSLLLFWGYLPFIQLICLILWLLSWMNCCCSLSLASSLCTGSFPHVLMRRTLAIIAFILHSKCVHLPLD